VKENHSAFEFLDNLNSVSDGEAGGKAGVPITHLVGVTINFSIKSRITLNFSIKSRITDNFYHIRALRKKN